jgi:hypothetical protein
MSNQSITGDERERYIVYADDDIAVYNFSNYKQDFIYTEREFRELVYKDIIPMLKASSIEYERDEIRWNGYTTEELVSWLEAYGPYDDYYHASMVRDRKVINSSDDSSDDEFATNPERDISSIKNDAGSVISLENENRLVEVNDSPEVYYDGEVFPNLRIDTPVIRPIEEPTISPITTRSRPVYFIHYLSDNNRETIRPMSHIFEYNESIPSTKP